MRDRRSAKPQRRPRGPREGRTASGWTSSPTRPDRQTARARTGQATAPEPMVATWPGRVGCERADGFLRPPWQKTASHCAMERKIRGLAKQRTRITELMAEARIPKLDPEGREPSRLPAASSIPPAIVSGTFNLSNGTDAVSTRPGPATPIEASVIDEEASPKMPIRHVRPGLGATLGFSWCGGGKQPRRSRVIRQRKNTKGENRKHAGRAEGGRARPGPAPIYRRARDGSWPFVGPEMGKKKTVSGLAGRTRRHQVRPVQIEGAGDAEDGRTGLMTVKLERHPR